uniref:Uncharacterized protein n=1 Tax=Oryza meridionalis TaxID=40149 RepID=A0A0E0CBA9_9ORYZ
MAIADLLPLPATSSMSGLGHWMCLHVPFTVGALVPFAPLIKPTCVEIATGAFAPERQTICKGSSESSGRLHCSLVQI